MVYAVVGIILTHIADIECKTIYTVEFILELLFFYCIVIT